MLRFVIWAISCVCALAPRFNASATPLVELTVGDQSYVGKSLAHDEKVCWLAQRDGRVTQVSLPQVTSFRTVENEFQPLSTMELRNQLRREFGHGWDIVSTGHYLVCAPRGRAQIFADSFERLYRSFRGYFSRRKFDLPHPDFPMVAVVYPTEQDFADNCGRDGVPYAPGLRGYYHRLTNRINVFEPNDSQLGASTSSGPPSGKMLISFAVSRPACTSMIEFSDASWDTTELDLNAQADLKDTIIHEATHQTAYNLGLHSRIGSNPRWMTEGLATMFEAEGTRQNTGGKSPKTRLNLSRFRRFAPFAAKGRAPESLVEFISSDRLFRVAPLDAYAQSWALTFFLAETRPQQHARYLEAVAARNPLEPYSPEERLSDFQQAFGSDLSRLEVAFLRYIADLQ